MCQSNPRKVVVDRGNLRLFQNPAVHDLRPLRDDDSGRNLNLLRERGHATTFVDVPAWGR
jgi:hypothetical protein